VDPLACVSLPAFPLQLLCRRQPGWAKLPVAVVDEDQPQGTILWVNERARRARVLPGHRYAHALALSPELRAGEVSSPEIAGAVAEVAARLRRFSPEIDPCTGEPGVFWLGAAGLRHVFPSLPGWARAIERELAGIGLDAAVVVGTARFATYALARARGTGVTVHGDADAEREAVRRVPIDRLGFDPDLRDALARLGVVTLGAFLRLPPGGLLERFGDQAFRLHRLASGDAWDPLQPQAPPEPLEERCILDDPEEDTDGLLFLLKRCLDPLLARLAARRAALAALFVEMKLYRQDKPRLDVIRPAEPTLDARALLRLLHLRLESAPPAAGVIELLVSAEDVPATREQLQLFHQRPRRDLRAANEALARLRAELGDDAVVHPILRDGHLPEARFGWARITDARLPRPRAPTGGTRPLVRRLFGRAQLLPPQNAQVRDDGWLLRGLEHGPVTRLVGPFIVSGGWWAGEVHREYAYAFTRRGDCLWVYYDRRRRRWLLHGLVE
jgi:protein ImuB